MNVIHLKQQISQIFPWIFVTGGGRRVFLIYFGGFASFIR